MKKVLLYHGSCLDGSAGAAVFSIYYKDEEKYLIPVRHAFDEDALSAAQSLIDKNTHLYFIDNMFLVNELVDLASKITIIDHHESNKELGEKLANIKDNLQFIYDVDKSGATLAWSYFFPKKETPIFLQHIEEIDLWKFKNKELTEKVATYASMYLDNIDKFIEFIQKDIQNIYKDGELLVQYRDMLVDYYLRNANALHLRIGKHVVKAFNVASIRTIVSIFGNVESEKTKEAVCMFKIFGKDKVNLSFRSTDASRVTAQELAEELGGGGHKNAAGASIKLKDFINRIEDIRD